jgi:transposase
MFHRRNLCSGEKRGLCVGPTKRGKGTKIMAIADSHGLPIAVCTESASPAEVKLVERTVEQRFVADPPERLIGDKAYDSDALDEQMMSGFATELIAPHRQGRRPERKTQDGRALRRFRRRWKIERLFAWMYNFRRLVVRWEYHAENFLGFVHLGCAIILLRYL